MEFKTIYSYNFSFQFYVKIQNVICVTLPTDEVYNVKIWCYYGMLLNFWINYTILCMKITNYISIIYNIYLSKYIIIIPNYNVDYSVILK